MDNINWGSVKKLTLWTYDELINKIKGVLKYDFVKEHYSFTYDQHIKYFIKLQKGYRTKPNGDTYLDKIKDDIFKLIEKLKDSDNSSYIELINRLETKDKCIRYLQINRITFEELILFLNYIFRWFLPFPASIREFLYLENENEKKYLLILKKNNIRLNLDLLQLCRTQEDLIKFSSQTDIPESFLKKLTHRTDISRLAYVRGKTVLHLSNGAYDSLKKIAKADEKEMELNMERYYNKIGKKLSDFKAVIPLKYMIGGAKAIPEIILY